MRDNEVKVRGKKRRRAADAGSGKVAETPRAESPWLSSEIVRASRTRSRELLPGITAAPEYLVLSSDFDPGFGFRYFNIPEGEFYAEADINGTVACHLTRSDDGGPLVFLKATIGHRPDEIRALATKLLLIANDAEELSRDTQFCRCFRRY